MEILWKYKLTLKTWKSRNKNVRNDMESTFSERPSETTSFIQGRSAMKENYDSHRLITSAVMLNYD